MSLDAGQLIRRNYNVETTLRQRSADVQTTLDQRSKYDV